MINLIQSMQLRTVLSIAAMFVMSACFSSAQTQSGIEGTITIAPARPGPARIDAPDSAPLANIAFVVKNDSGTSASFTTDGEGKFHISLAPGHYTVSRAESKSGIGHFGPFEVDVVAGKMTKVEWRCDSGMR